jgi:peptide/nickel transport system permease protein
LFLLMAVGADWLAPYGPDDADTLFPQPQPPSWKHWLGTDPLQKDVFSRVLFGSRLSLVAGLLSIGLAALAGTPLGAVAGYFGGRCDALVMRTIDVALTFPSVLIALLLAAAFRPGWATVVLAVGLINVPIFARQIRATVLSLREAEYLLACRAMGASAWYILTRQIVPGLVSPVVVLASLSIGTAVLEVAGLSFLGLGGDLTEPEWGAMLAQARDYRGTNLWFALGPGIAISLTVLGFNLLGDGLRDALDPRSDARLL